MMLLRLCGWLQWFVCRTRNRENSLLNEESHWTIVGQSLSSTSKSGVVKIKAKTSLLLLNFLVGESMCLAPDSCSLPTIAQPAKQG